MFSLFADSNITLLISLLLLYSSYAHAEEVSGLIFAMAVSSDVYSCDDSETCTMSSSEETILLSLLPLFQKKLVVKQLQPFLKLFCSFTDDECDLVCGPNAALQKDSAALMLVEVLRRKSPQCCAQMLLTALQQSCTKSGRHIWGHNEVAGALQIKLASAGTPGGHSLQSKGKQVTYSVNALGTIYKDIVEYQNSY